VTTDTITFHTPDGDVTMPVAQAESLQACARVLLEAGDSPTWHFNECGCCIAVHENVEHPSTAFIVGRDGGVDLIRL
jgi:hypothetical protein